MSTFIIRNGGFQKKEAMKSRPASIAEGSLLKCKTPTSTMAKDKFYRVIGHFCYLNTYGPKGEKVALWDEFVTIKNDYGYTIKVNRHAFYS